MSPAAASPAAVPGPAAAVPAATAAQRAALRATVALAARVLPVHHPLHAFVAVNPLGGLEDQPFGDALRHAADLYGAPGTLTEEAFRAAYAAGRVDDGDLDAVLARRFPQLAAAPPVTVGGRTVDRLALAKAELLHAPPLPAPVRRQLTRAERLDPAVAAAVDAHAARWCAAYVGAAPGWPLPGRAAGLYAAWRGLAAHDPGLPRPVRAALRRGDADVLPERPEDAVLRALRRLGVGPEEHLDHLRAHLSALPGWAAHLRWRDAHGHDGDLLGYLALRLTYEDVLLAAAGVAAVAEPPPAEGPRLPAPWRRAVAVAAALGLPATDDELATVALTLAAYPPADRPLLWQEAYEGHWRDRLLRRLPTRPPAAPAGRPGVQVVCCIDVRSEGLRRRVEARAGYETAGFAGFFAVAMRYADLAGAAVDQCPALVEPGVTVPERPAPGAGDAAARRLAGLRLLAGGRDAFHAAEGDPAAPYVLAEVGGVAAAPLAAARTVAPGLLARLRGRLHRAVAPPAATRVDVAAALDAAERALFAEALLATTGLGRRLARLVVLCGHGASTENNPYQAALDCGACGGHRGGPNARAAAAVLNDPAVRARLADRGAAVPADTWFVAAEHDTTTDRVTPLDVDTVPATHRADVARAAADLAAAGAELAAARRPALPGAPRRARTPRAAARHAAARAGDWAQVFPEWGLAGNAAFVAGPRTATAGVDLGGRVFLHSYDADTDPDGTALETIMTAPLVVAQWINCQYLFSTVAPEVFGAGTKTVHNVVGGAGVLAGPGGDLRLGLPWQSVADGERLVHEPVRLLAVVYAAPERVAAVLDRNPAVRRLVDHGWIALAVPDGDGWLRREAGAWQPWTRREPSARRKEVRWTAPA